jgi:hypothetical protein
MPRDREHLLAALRAPALLETLAALEHERWSHWQEYLHSLCRPGDGGDLIIPAELVARWTAQLSTPYADLAEQEKDSDREQVSRYLPSIEAALGPLHDAEGEQPGGTG